MKKRKSAKVIGLFGTPEPQPGEVRQDVIESLEKALERARAGQTIGICLVETSAGAKTVTQWVVSGYTTRSTIGALMEIVVEECRK